MMLSPVNVPSHLKDFVEPQNRPALDRATRDELLGYAKTKGMNLDANMPRDLIIQILRERGFTDIKAAVRVMGMPVAYVGDDGVPDTGKPQIKQVNAAEDLKRQWEQKESIKNMSMGELRKEAKARGIKMSRRDNMQTLREKLNG